MAMSKASRQRYDRDRKRAQGATGRDYDASSDTYELQPAQLANLEIRRRAIRSAASKRRDAILRYLEQGLSVADIVMATGISRAAVYRLMPATAKRAYVQHVDPLLL